MSLEAFPLKIKILGFLFTISACLIPPVFIISTAAYGPSTGLTITGILAAVAGILYALGWTAGRQTELKIMIQDAAGEDFELEVTPDTMLEAMKKRGWYTPGRDDDEDQTG